MSHSRWNSLVRKILDDKQKARFDKLRQQRAARVHTACISAFCCHRCWRRRCREVRHVVPDVRQQVRAYRYNLIATEVNPAGGTSGAKAPSWPITTKKAAGSQWTLPLVRFPEPIKESCGSVIGTQCCRRTSTAFHLVAPSPRRHLETPGFDAEASHRPAFLRRGSFPRVEYQTL